MSKHENYEILNLLGYGLAKFDMDFVREFGFQTKTAFYDFFIDLKIAETRSVVKNRMDLFDPFFESNRKGWWQKKNVYHHRKILIDSLFGHEDVGGFSNIVKIYLKSDYGLKEIFVKESPIVQTKFRSLQQTGLAAELFFKENYQNESLFKNGLLEDARLYGDGYDFQISVGEIEFLAEVKGVREKKGPIRLTEKEFSRAQEYQENYVLSVVVNLNNSPEILLVPHPTKALHFKEVPIQSKERVEYHLIGGFQ